MSIKPFLFLTQGSIKYLYPSTNLSKYIYIYSGGNPDAHKIFLLINEAKEILSDEMKRRIYDESESEEALMKNKKYYYKGKGKGTMTKTTKRGNSKVASSVSSSSDSSIVHFWPVSLLVALCMPLILSSYFLFVRYATESRGATNN
jgi:hypothetical protein